MQENKHREKYIIGISSGHSLLDKGAFCHFTGEYEFYYTSKLSIKIQEVLSYYGYTIYSPDSITDKEKYPDHLKHTVKLLNMHNPHLAIELHFNFFEDKKVNGCELLYNEEGKNFAALLQKEICSFFNVKDRGIKTNENKYFISHTEIPAVITEPIFLSNENDIKIIEKETFDRDFSLVLLKCLDIYFLKTDILP